MQPKGLRDCIDLHLSKWALKGVDGHFEDPSPWLTIDDEVQASMANLVGAWPQEVVVMNSLSCNLHLMLLAFYRPTETKNKIMIEKKAFPSDYFIVESQIKLHGLDPSDLLIEIEARNPNGIIELSDIEEVAKLM